MPDRKWIILGITVLAQMAASGTTQGIPTLAPFLQSGLNLSKTEIGLLNSSISVGMAVSLLVGGWAADRVGSRVVTLSGLFATALGLAGASLGHSLVQVALFLFLSGIGGGVTMPAVSRAVMVWFSRQDRGFAMSLQRTATPLVGAIAAATLPGIAVALGWRSGVLVLAVAPVVVALVFFATYQEDPKDSLRSDSANRKAGNPLPLLRNRNILLSSVLPTALVAAQFSLVSYLILYLTETASVSLALAAASLAVVQLGGVGGRIFWGLVSDRLLRGSRRIVLLLIGAVSCALLAIVGLLPAGAPFWVVMTLAALLGVFLLGWHGIYTVLMSELAPRGLAGSSVGIGATVMRLGAVVGPPGFGYIVDSTGHYNLGWWALGAVAFLGVVLFLPVKEDTGR